LRLHFAADAHLGRWRRVVDSLAALAVAAPEGSAGTSSALTAFAGKLPQQQQALLSDVELDTALTLGPASLPAASAEAADRDAFVLRGIASPLVTLLAVTAAHGLWDRTAAALPTGTAAATVAIASVIFTLLY
jgi:hypothetical protein